MIDIKEFINEPASVDDVTRGIQEAIEACARDSGGRVNIPAGEWTCRTILLRSGVELHLAPGAVLRPDTDLDHYPQYARGHNKDRQPYHLIVAEDAEDIAISGRGVIDGRGMEFWDEPPEGSPYYRAKGRRISPLVDIKRCRRVTLRDIRIINSPGWTVHTFTCDHVLIDHVTIENHLYGPNTDGLDINGCRHVMVSNCRIHGCDDNIILKATRDARSCEYVTVTNCVLESTCAAIGLGAETISGIRHVAVSNCTVINSIRMIQIIMWSGGVVENVVFSNITGRALTAVGTDRAIHFDIQEHRGENPELGRMRNIQCSNIVCETRGRILLTAQDGAELEHIVLRDVRLVYPEVEDPEATIPKSGSSQLSNFSPEARVARAAVVADNVDGLVLDNVSAQWPDDPANIAAPMHGIWARNVRNGVVNCPFLAASGDGIEAVRASGSTLKFPKA